MSVALGWMALALAVVSGTPDGGRGGVPIRYTVRYMEAEGVEWREGVFTRLTPVTRQGSATVWTAPQDVAKRLVQQAKKGQMTGIANGPTMIARPGSAAHIVTGCSRQLVTQAAWNGDDHSVEAKSEKVRTGSAATLIGATRSGDPGADGAQGHPDPRRAPRAAGDGEGRCRERGRGSGPLFMRQEAALGEGFPPVQSMKDDLKYFKNHPENPWSDIPAIVESDTAMRPPTANVNQKRMPLKTARREDKLRSDASRTRWRRRSRSESGG